MFAPPPQSEIAVTRAPGAWIVTLPLPARRLVGRIGVLTFLSIWLAGWSLGGAFAINQVINGTSGTEWFLFIWLTGWAFGWVFVAGALISLLRPRRRARFVISSGDVLYDRGHDPTSVNRGNERGHPGWNPFEPRRRTFAKQALATLRSSDCGTHLTFEVDGKAVTLGYDLTPGERDWLITTLPKL
ncbi:MAG: hypothetical protein AAGJ70_04315 [Pseudomonadota bacterium]